MRKNKKVLVLLVCFFTIILSNTSFVKAEENLLTVDPMHVFTINFDMPVKNTFLQSEEAYNKNSKVFDNIYLVDENGNKYINFYPKQIDSKTVKLYLYSSLPKNKTLKLHVDNFVSISSNVKMDAFEKTVFVNEYVDMDIFKLVRGNFEKIDKSNISYNKNDIILKQNVKDDSKYYVKTTNNVYIQLEKVKNENDTILFKVSDNIIYR